MPPHALQTEALWETEPIQTAAPADEKQESRRNGRQRVRFLETVSFREIAPLTELSDDEIKSVWYNDDEYAKIKKHVSATIKKCASGDTIQELEGFCMRGLEGRTKFGARRRKNNKAAALDAVWKTQISLWKKKADNPAVIAAAYRPHSMHAKYPAMETGLSDQKFVRGLQGEVETR